MREFFWAFLMIFGYGMLFLGISNWLWEVRVCTQSLREAKVLGQLLAGQWVVADFHRVVTTASLVTFRSLGNAEGAEERDVLFMAGHPDHDALERMLGKKIFLAFESSSLGPTGAEDVTPSQFLRLA